MLEELAKGLGAVERVEALLIEELKVEKEEAAALAKEAFEVACEYYDK